MFLELENHLYPEPLLLNQVQRSALRDDTLRITFRFPKIFGRSLYTCFEQLVVNSPSDFLSTRTNAHLLKILCMQFFLQRKIESALKQGNPKQFFLKLFKGQSRICVGMAFSSNLGLPKEQVQKAMETLLPGISEIPRSFYLCHSSESPYFFCYFEVSKLRGKDLSTSQLRTLEKSLKEQMFASSPLTPTVFWPYNKEESHRQIQLLLREMHSKNDLPHISIHFQEQTATSLEFLVHLVRPRGKQPIELEKLPESLYFFRYSRHQLNTPFPIEAEAFSIKMQSHLFDVRDTINLLYARRFLAKYLEALIGPFRDFNGGLFEKQQDQFETFRLHLSDKIPYFDLFAEKVFYALHPFERWFSLSLQEVEELFRLFSDLIQDERIYATKSSPCGLFTVVKMENSVDSLRLSQKKPQGLVAHGQLTIGSFSYECFSGRVCEPVHSQLQLQTDGLSDLRLAFQEGAPPSLNPHYSSGDMRSRIVNKLLFEGLTRLNEQGKPELAGAAAHIASIDGLTHTFIIKKSHWSNGEKVTAFDYVDTWKWVLQDLTSHPELLFSIKNAKNFREKKCDSNQLGIRAIDPETLEIKLETPDPTFLEKLAQPFFYPLFGVHREPKWFNGPYLVQEVKKNGIKLGPNPYFRANCKPGFGQVAIQWIDNIDGIYQLFKQEKIDWIGDPISILSADQIQELEASASLRKQKVRRRLFLHFNTNTPLLSSVKIRKALSWVIDRNLICREIFPHSIPIEAKGDKIEAAQLLKEALQELGLNTLPPIVLSYSDQTRRDPLATYLQKVWKDELEVTIDLQKQSWNTFRTQLEKRRFEICFTIHSTIDEENISFLEKFEGSSSWNFSGWVHPPYRELIQSGLKQQAEQMLEDHLPCTPLFDYVHLYAHHSRIESFYFDAEGCVDFSKGKYKQ